MVLLCVCIANREDPEGNGFSVSAEQKLCEKLDYCKVRSDPAEKKTRKRLNKYIIYELHSLYYKSEHCRPSEGNTQTCRVIVKVNPL